MLTANPGRESPARTHNQCWNRRNLSRPFRHAAHEQSPRETVSYCANDDQPASRFGCGSYQFIKRRTGKYFFNYVCSQFAQSVCHPIEFRTSLCKCGSNNLESTSAIP